MSRPLGCFEKWLGTLIGGGVPDVDYDELPQSLAVCRSWVRDVCKVLMIATFLAQVATFEIFIHYYGKNHPHV